MGSITSRDLRREEEMRKQDMVYNEALRKYNERIMAYKYHPSMPFWKYEKLCRSQFELEILPDCVKYGTHYSGNY